MALYGTEIVFVLGPGMHDEARAVARRLAAAAAGASRHVLFLNDAGEYGALAEWSVHEDAAAYASRPATAAVLDDLTARLGRRPSVRVYAMEEHVTGTD